MDLNNAPLYIYDEGLPRACGDGPCINRLAYRETTAPPRMRGWTLLAPLAVQFGVGSPAHAGMDPDRQICKSFSPRLPRACGDGPNEAGSIGIADEAPPRMRGWTKLAESVVPADEGSPAHAGMDPPHGLPTVIVTRLPRACGDGPTLHATRHPTWWAPPRMRGWTPITLEIPLRALGSPAHAGMDPSASPSLSASLRLPRACGDGPLTIDPLPSHIRAPPRMRGWTLSEDLLKLLESGSPAHAGMDP